MPYNDQEQITKDDLINNEEFLNDASSFLYNRTGAFLTDPEKIYDAYAKHMRFHSTNEVTVARDLMYAQEATDEDKAAFGRLLNSFDKLDTDASTEWNELLADYGMSIATAPSTWLAAITAGTGKAAALTGQQAAKLGVRQVVNSAMRGAVVESGVAAGQEVGRETTKVETGLQDEIRGENVLLSGALGGAFGAAGGSLSGALAVRNANKALALQKKAEEAVSVRVGKAAEEADKTIQTKTDTATVVKERLKALDPDMVAEGRAVKDENFTPLEMTMVSLDLNVKKGVIAAATDLVTKADLVDADGNAIRITEAVVNKLRNGSLTADIIDEVREKYNLTAEQFGLIFGADLSDYGRGLNLASQLKKNVNKREALETLIDNVSEIANAKTSKGKQLGGVTDQQLAEVHELHKGLGVIADEATGFIKGFERLRRGILTTQPQTTLRNIAGGAFRVLLDAPEYIMEEMTKKIYNGLAGRKVYETSPIATIVRNSVSIMKYMSPVSVAGGSPQAAEIIAQMYIRNNPDSAQRLFHMFIEGADASYNSKTFNAMSQIGAGLNFMNRYSDDVFKKAIFAGELDRLVMTRYNKSLTDIVAEGKFQDIDQDFFKKAGEKAFELLYQKIPKGKSLAATFARGYLEADKRAISGIALGALIPFPRFVINQIEFMYDHAPILGLMSSKSTPEKMAKQLSGLGMITAAFMFRAEQGEDTEWYTGVNEDGSTVDLRPFLGPLNLHMYMADLFYKHWDSTKSDVENTAILYDKTDMKTVTEIAFGSAFRVGTGAYLINSAVPEFAEALQTEEGGEQESKIKFQRAWGRLIGDYAATFTYALPIAVARDIYKLTDEELRKIPETNGNVAMMDIIKLRATRTLPGEWREAAIEKLGGLEQEPISDVRYEITTNEPTRSVDPFGTMVTGLSRQREPNMLEKELTRLGISAYDLYKPVPLGPADVMIRKQLSGNGEIPSLYNYLKPLLVSNAYKQRSKEEQQYLLQAYGRAYVSDVRNQIYDVLIEKAQAKEVDFTVGQILNFQLESVPALARKSAIKIYEREYGKFNNRNEKQVEMVIDISKVIEKEFEYDEEEKKKYARGGLVTRNYAEGGFVNDDPMMLSETAEEMDPVAREKAGQEYIDQMIELGLDTAPGIGEIRSGQQAVEDYEAGDYFSAGLGALGAIPVIGAPARKIRKVLDATERFADKKITDRVNKTMERRAKNDELKSLSDRNELPEEFSGLRLNDEVDIPGVASGRIGRVYYDREGNAMINIATGLEDNPLVGVPVAKAVEKGVVKTKEAPVYKTKVNIAKDPSMEFVGRPYDQMLREAKEADPKLYEELKTLENENPEEFGKQVFEFERDKWLQKTGKTPNTEVTERNKIMQNAANQVKEGKLSVEEFRKIADQHKPVKIWDDVPEMATYEDMFFALDAKKRQSPFVGYNARIPEGTRMTSRLDIPAYTSSDTWVVTLKGDYNDGKNMYAPAVRLKNVDLNQSLKNQEKALGVAAGKAKGPFAVMEGDYVEETAEDTYNLAKEALESGEWVQVGYDPTRRGFFYDRETMEPVLAAEEIVQVGPMVLAKGATKGDAKDFKFAKGGLMSRK